MYMKRTAYWKIEDEYLSIMDSDNEKAALTAYILSTLSTRKRKYFIKYLEAGSARKLATATGKDYDETLKTVNQLKREIYDKYTSMRR